MWHDIKCLLGRLGLSHTRSPGNSHCHPRSQSPRRPRRPRRPLRWLTRSRRSPWMKRWSRHWMRRHRVAMWIPCGYHMAYMAPCAMRGSSFGVRKFELWNAMLGLSEHVRAIYHMYAEWTIRWTLQQPILTCDFIVPDHSASNCFHPC